MNTIICHMYTFDANAYKIGKPSDLLWRCQFIVAFENIFSQLFACFHTILSHNFVSIRSHIYTPSHRIELDNFVCQCKAGDSLAKERKTGFEQQ